MSYDVKILKKVVKKMKKVVSALLAVLMLCSLTLVAFAATMRFSVIDNTYADASTTLIEADLGAQQKTSLKITAQVYKYSSAADDYMRSVKFEESASNSRELALREYYSLNIHDKVVFTFTAGGETYTETCYVHS